MPPFPGQRVYGTDPRRQGYVAGEILQEREDFSSHRKAPLTAPVPFRRTRWTSGKGGQKQRRRKPTGAGYEMLIFIQAGENEAALKLSNTPAYPFVHVVPGPSTKHRVVEEIGDLNLKQFRIDWSLMRTSTPSLKHRSRAWIV